MYDHSKSTINKLPQNEGASETAVLIGKQVGVGRATVERAANFTQAVDIIVSNTGIKASDILSGRMKGYQDDIKALSELDADYHQNYCLLAYKTSGCLNKTRRLIYT